MGCRSPGPRAASRFACRDGSRTRDRRFPVRRGRGFTETDRHGAEPVAVVSEELARALWPGQDPIGKRIAYPYESPWMTVVGVVPDLKIDNMRDTTVSA